MTVHLASLMRTINGVWGVSIHGPCGVYAPKAVTIVETEVTCKGCRRARCWPAALAMNATAPPDKIDLKQWVSFE